MALLGLFSLPALAEVKQRGTLRVSVNGKFKPKRLPRKETAPISISFAGQIGTTDQSGPPQLRSISIEINRHGRLMHRGLPVCNVTEISPSTTRGALAACRASLVGDGSFSANVKLPEQSPFPSKGKVLAFNGRVGGKPAILAHIFGTDPVPSSYVLPFMIRSGKGDYGTVLDASLPRVTGDWGFVTGISMTLDRQFRYRGERYSYMAANCPAAPGFREAQFPLARTSFAFDGGTTMTSTLIRSCRVRN